MCEHNNIPFYIVFFVQGMSPSGKMLARRVIRGVTSSQQTELWMVTLTSGDLTNTAHCRTVVKEQTLGGKWTSEGYSTYCAWKSTAATTVSTES